VLRINRSSAFRKGDPAVTSMVPPMISPVDQALPSGVIRTFDGILAFSELLSAMPGRTRSS
jgi:hypothetical protein